MNEKDFIPKNFGGEENVRYPFKEKCPVVLLLDTSGSMSGKPINELNSGVKLFRDELINDDFARKSVEVSIITFGGNVQEIQNFCLAEDWSFINLTANGGTPLGQAIDLAVNKLTERKRFLRQSAGVNYFKPWMITITDGYPTDISKGNQNWNNTTSTISNEVQNGHSLPWAFGTETADMDALKELYGEKRVFRLANANFKSIFLWLSDSLKIVSNSAPGDKIKVPTPVKYEDISIEI